MDIPSYLMGKKAGGGGEASDYSALTNKPSINSVTLNGNKTSSNLGLQNEITSNNRLSADLIDDTSTTNKFVTASDKTAWNGKYDLPLGGIPSTDLSNAVQTSLGKADTALQSETYTGTITGITMNGTSKGTSGVVDLGTVITDVSGKQDKETITTDTSATTATLTLASNNEYRYTQNLTSLTITLPASIDNDFIAWVVFNSGSTATTITIPNTVKISGDDVESNVFTPVANKTYNIGFWYDGINVNAVVRGA